MPKSKSEKKRLDTQARAVVINRCFGGFSLSYEGVMLYAKKKGITISASTAKRTSEGQLIDINTQVPYVHEGGEAPFMIHYHTKPLGKNGHILDKSYFSDRDIPRDDPALVEVVDELGKKADGAHAELEIVYIPKDVEWEVAEYDGNEHVAEKHRTW